MNTTLKMSLMVVSIGMAFHASHAQAAVATNSVQSNAVNYCQAFTPGPANTVRNRVVGAENVGAAAIAVACNFQSNTNGAAGNTAPTNLDMFFANNNAAGTITITCTLLTGYQSQTGTSVYARTKTTAAIPAGGTSQRILSWAPADNPVVGATSLGNYLVGVNCTLPTGGVINDSYLAWREDNGV